MQALPRHRPLYVALRIARARHPGNTITCARSLAISSCLYKQDQNAFAKTLLLPKTSFPLWADPLQREEPYRNRTTEELYKWQVCTMIL
jgi:hypothetical protein